MFIYNGRSHLENLELKAEYMRLQESYRELEQMKDSLEDTKATCQLNLTDAQKEAEKTRTEVLATSSLLRFLPRCMECSHGIAMGILSVRPSVRLSVRLSVKRVHCDKTEESYV